jgi:hypothetical protein
MKRLKIITTGTSFLLSLSIFFSCDTRKDIIPALEQTASTAPTITIRRHNSGQMYVNNFKDTTLLGSAGYRLDYLISGSANLSTLSFSCVSGCSNVTYNQIKPDSGLILLFVNNGTAASFTLTVSNNFGQSGTAYFNIVTLDQAPVLYIQNFNYALTYIQKLNDTIKTILNPVYSLGYQLSGYNVNSSNIFVKRVSSADATPIVIGSQITFNYSNVKIPTNYSYKIYAVDPLGKVSDTCLLNIYAFKDLPPVFDALVSASCASTTSYETDSYLGNYLGGTGPEWNAFPCMITINAHDHDPKFGGYVQKIRWRIQYTNWANSKTFDQTFVNTYQSINTSFALNFDSPWYQVYFQWAGTNLNALLSGSLIDNNNDSTLFSTTVTF